MEMSRLANSPVADMSLLRKVAYYVMLAAACDKGGHVTRPRSASVLASTVLIWVFLSASAIAGPAAQRGDARARPNIVWLVLDDASPAIGAYGDPQATTPNMDRLAREGVRFTRAYTHTPVCAPSRSGLVTGRYPTSIGSHNMRSSLINPPETFMSLLRKAGYFVSWPGKTDFNFVTAGATGGLPPGAADSTRPWLNEPPPAQPFFAYLNLPVTHESQVRGNADLHAKNTARLRPSDRHDPGRMRVPSYLPDAPEVRQDLAQFYDLMTAADYQVGDVLEWLERNRLAENTVVVLFSDHGIGMPRAKRWPYRSGIHVPLIVRWPAQIRRGTVRDDIVAFVDFAPTMLALAGASVPGSMEGQIFLGQRRAAERKYAFAHRDRMDEAVDRVRTVVDTQFQYIRNFRHDLPYAQTIAYNEQNPTMQVWRRLSAAGTLTGPAALFFASTKPREELYDITVDPDTVRNLASDVRSTSVLTRMRRVLNAWLDDSGDLGAFTEAELIDRGILASGRSGRGPGASPQVR